MTSKRLDTIDNRIANALAHPLRRKILRRLGESPSSPNQMALEFDEVLTNVSYHVRALNKLGCLRQVYTRQRRGATEHFYTIKASAFLSARDWQPMPPAIRVGLASRSLRGFLSHVIPVVSSRQHWAKRGGALHWFSTAVDNQGWDEMSATIVSFLVDIMEIAEQSGDRLQGLESSGVTVVAGAACFKTQP